jgi:hypothetical protein
MLKWCAHHMAHGKEDFWPGGRHFQLIQLEDRERREAVSFLVGLWKGVASVPVPECRREQRELLEMS